MAPLTEATVAPRPATTSHPQATLASVSAAPASQHFTDEGIPPKFVVGGGSARAPSTGSAAPSVQPKYVPPVSPKAVGH